jgi:hypothetical protein
MVAFSEIFMLRWDISFFGNLPTAVCDYVLILELGT